MTISRSSERPLSNMRVMVTRPEDPHDPLAEQLGRLGAEVIVQPAIRIAPPADWRPVDAALARLNEFDWLVFSSANGVRYLLDRLRKKGSQCVSEQPGTEVVVGAENTQWNTFFRQPPPSPFSLKLAAIGPGTADELARYGLGADLVPGQYRAEALAEALAHEAPGRRFLLARASRGREVLAEQLSAAGATVEQIVVYSSTDVHEADPAVAALLRAGRIDWITVTSSAIARSLAGLFGEDLRRAKLASISPLTSGTLRELGHQPVVEAAEYTVDGLVTAIVNAPSPLGRGSG
jgi:uroporphyrinogen III methyltransferase / synthase